MKISQIPMNNKKNKVFDPLQAELRKTGLNKQEAEVYIWLLKKRISSVLNIAKETGYSRPTVYRIIKNLIKKELVIDNKKETKGTFIASAPDVLLKNLRMQKRKIEEEEREFLRIISILRSRYSAPTGQNEIKEYREKTFLEDIASTNEKNIFVFLLGNVWLEYEKIEKIYLLVKKRLGDIFIREFMISSEKQKFSRVGFAKRKILSIKNEQNGILIITDKIFILTGKSILCIEERDTVNFLKILFDLFWKII